MVRILKSALLFVPFVFFVFFVFFVVAPSAYAQSIPTSDWAGSGCLSDGDVATLACIPVVMQNIINFLIGFAAIVCVFIIIFAGFKFVTSEGDPEKIANARKTALYGLGGFVLVLASFLIMNFIGEFTGVTKFSPR